MSKNKEKKKNNLTWCVFASNFQHVSEDICKFIWTYRIALRPNDLIIKKKFL